MAGSCEHSNEPSDSLGKSGISFLAEAPKHLRLGSMHSVALGSSTELSAVDGFG